MIDTITVKIENVYDDGTTVATTETVTDLPRCPSDVELREDWAWDHLFPLTGTGREEGDAAYFVTVLDCPADPSLVGDNFQFGL